MDGATLWQEVRLVLLPLGMGGLASTGLLCLVLSWNEAFWSLNLSAAKAGTLATLIASLLQPRRPVLGQAVRRFAHGHCAHRGVRLVQPEAAGPRPDLRRRQVSTHLPHSFQDFRNLIPWLTCNCSGIEKFFGEHRAIKGIDLTIQQGEFIVFVGPSGCGKSTLLRLIAGLENIDGGTLQLDGRDITDQPSSKRDLAMVFQSYALYPHMSVFENMSFALKLAKVDPQVIDEKVQNAADILNLTQYLQRTPKELSGGQRQRVAIGRAIVRAPKVFLFDEPLSNLDAALRGQTRVEIAKLHRDLGATTIYVTHDQVEAMTLADRVVVLRDGVIEQVGTPLELYDQPGQPVRGPVHRHAADERGAPAAAAAARAAAGPCGCRGWLPSACAPRPLPCAARAPRRCVGQVDLVEALGAETLIYVGTPGGAQLVARQSERTSLRAGDAVSLEIDASEAHWFDPNGRVVARQAA